MAEIKCELKNSVEAIRYTSDNEDDTLRFLLMQGLGYNCLVGGRINIVDCFNEKIGELNIGDYVLDEQWRGSNIISADDFAKYYNIIEPTECNHEECWHQWGCPNGDISKRVCSRCGRIERRWERVGE
jgi:hypothetical protein